MLLTNLFENYKTKDGKEITMVREKDIYEENRGWQVDKVTAEVGGEEVGYIKLSYIPNKRWHYHFKTIFDYLDKVHGWGLGLREGRSRHYTVLDPDERRYLLKQVMIYSARPLSLEDEKRIKQISDKEVIAELKDAEQKLESRGHGRKFREFKNYHKDKPVVDFINVDGKYRRQRIGEALYREGARWMKERGMKMYASGSQSKEAKASWEHMKKNLKVTKAKRGRKTLEPVD